MKQLFALPFILCLLSCADEYTDNTSAPAINARQVTVQEPSIFDKKEFVKKGTVMAFEPADIQAEKGVKLWSNPYPPKDAVHTLQYGEKVIVYARASDYLLVAPAKDTSKLGYVLSGWIIMEGSEKKEAQSIEKPMYNSGRKNSRREEVTNVSIKSDAVTSSELHTVELELDTEKEDVVQPDSSIVY